MKTEQCTIYVTDDGKEFLSKEEAADHELKERLNRAIEDWLPLPSSDCWTAATALWEHRDELRNLLFQDLPMLSPDEYQWLVSRLGRKIGKPPNKRVPGVDVLEFIQRCYQEYEE